MITDLASLLAPLSVDDFRRARAERRMLHVPATNAHRYTELMSWQTLNELIDRGQLPGENFRLMREGTRVPREWFAPGGVVDAMALRGLLRQPVTVVMLDIGTLWEPMRSLVRRLQQQLGHAVVCGAIATLTKGGAFKPHFDLSDLLLLQVEGAKTWRVFGERERVPSAARAASLEPPTNVVQEFTMRQGDLLYLPRGVWHDASAGGHSLHVGLHLDTPRGVTFAEWLARRLASDPLLEEDLPLDAGADALAKHEARLKARLGEVVAGASVTEFLRETAHAVKPAPASSLGRSAAIGDPAAIVRLVAPRVPMLNGFSGREIAIFGGRLDVTPAVEAIVAVLRERPELALADLMAILSPTLEAPDVTDAVAALDRLGIVNLCSR